jgi:hypothetical protein
MQLYLDFPSGSLPFSLLLLQMHLEAVRTFPSFELCAPTHIPGMYSMPTLSSEDFSEL